MKQPKKFNLLLGVFVSVVLTAVASSFLVQAQGGATSGCGNGDGNACLAKDYFYSPGPALITGLLTADGGLTIPSGKTATLNGGLSATTGTFSELLAADGGFTIPLGKNATFNGPLIANSGLTIPSGQTATLNGGLTATTGTFSGLLTANGGLSATTGTFSGLLTANGGLTIPSGQTAELNGGIDSTTGSFTGFVTGTDATFTSLTINSDRYTKQLINLSEDVYSYAADPSGTQKTTSKCDAAWTGVFYYDTGTNGGSRKYIIMNCALKYTLAT